MTGRIWMPLLVAAMLPMAACRKDKTTDTDQMPGTGIVYDDSTEIIVSEDAEPVAEPATTAGYSPSDYDNDEDYSDDADYSDHDDYSDDDDDDANDTDKKGALRKKAKGVYQAGKKKFKEKKDEWKEDHADQIDEVKEKGRELKSKTKAKIGGWLDRAREKLEE